MVVTKFQAQLDAIFTCFLAEIQTKDAIIESLLTSNVTVIVVTPQTDKIIPVTSFR